MFISYAQNGEDVWLQRVFENKNDGFYIDVGANMPVIDSVTKAFYDRGWRGINIEPIPNIHAQLVAERPRDINLPIGVGDQIGPLELHIPLEVVHGAASFDVAAAEIVKERGMAGTTLIVDVTTLTTICQQYAVDHIDFLKIDVEGFEEKVILGMDFIIYRPTIIIVEATMPFHIIRDPVIDAESATWHGWEPMLLEAGYLFATFDGLNRYYVRQEDKALVSKFIIPISTLVDGYSKNIVQYQAPTLSANEVPHVHPEQVVEPWEATYCDSNKIKELSRAMSRLYLT